MVHVAVPTMSVLQADVWARACERMMYVMTKLCQLCHPGQAFSLPALICAPPFPSNPLSSYDDLDTFASSIPHMPMTVQNSFT